VIAILAALVASLALPAFGQGGSPLGRPRTTEPTALLSYLRVGNARVALTSDTIVNLDHRVALEQSTFGDVARMLAPATPTDSGDASSSLAWVCYRLRDSISLVLESDEMGSGEYIDSFELVRAGSRPDLERACIPLGVSPAAVQSDRGIRLGLTRREVSRRLGVIGRDSANVVIFDRLLEKDGRSRDGTRQPYTESSGFIVRFRQGRVAEIHGWRVDAT
jgi:hypothetical protein